MYFQCILVISIPHALPHHSPIEPFLLSTPPLSSAVMGCVFVTLSLNRVAHMNMGGRLLNGTTYSGFTTEEQPQILTKEFRICS